MIQVVQNTARPFKILMVSDSDNKTPVTGLEAADFTTILAKSGLSENEVEPTFVERQDGVYEVTPLAAHRDTLGVSSWTFEATGAVTAYVFEEVIVADARSVAFGANTTTPPTVEAIASQTRTELAAELQDIVDTEDRTANIYSVVQLTDADVAAIKAKTDSLTFTVAGFLDVNLYRWRGTQPGTLDSNGFVPSNTAAINGNTAAVVTLRTALDNNYFAKLNVSGTLAHTDNAATFRATGYATPSDVTSAVVDISELVQDSIDFASSVDLKLSSTRLIKIDGLPEATAGTSGGLSLVGSAMSLTNDERTATATVVDAMLLDAGDATDLIASIVTRIDNTNVDQAAFVAAVKAALFDSNSASNKLSVDSSGNVNIGVNNDKTGYSLTPITGLGNQTANITGSITSIINGVIVTTNNDKTGYSLTPITGLGNQTTNITGNISGSIGSVINGVTVTTNNDKTGYALSAGYQDALVAAIDAALLDAGDATDLIASITARIGNTNVDEAALVGLIRADVERNGGLLKLLSDRATELRLSKLDRNLAAVADVQVTTNPTVLSAGSIDAIRDGIATSNDIDNSTNAILLSIGEIDIEPVVNPTPITVNPTMLSNESLDNIAARLFVDPTERLSITNGLVTATNGGITQLPNIPDRTTTNGSPLYRLREVVYIRESAAQGLLEAATIAGVSLTNNGWVYDIVSGTTSREMLHGDRRRISNQSIIKLPENAFVDKIQAHVLIHNALSRELSSNDANLQ